MKVFSMGDLQATARVAHSTCKRFVNQMIKARLIRELNSQDITLYRLNVDLGAKHPIVTSDGVRCGNNTERFFPFKEEQ